MENTSTYNIVQASLPFPVLGKAQFMKKAAKAEKAASLKKQPYYPTGEACIYIGYSRWVLKRMVDLGLLTPRKFFWSKRTKYYRTIELDNAKRRYEALKMGNKLDKLPLCTCQRLRSISN